VPKSSLVFLDGSGIRAEPRPLKGLSPRGQPANTSAEKPEKYEPRIDIMGAICYHGPLACETKTSKQRQATPNPKTRKRGVKGYTKPMVKNFLRIKLSPKIQDMKAKEVITWIKGSPSKRKRQGSNSGLEGLRKSRLYGFYLLILPSMSARLTIPYGTV